MQCLLNAEILSALRLEPNGQTAEYRWGLTASQSFLLCVRYMHACVRVGQEWNHYQSCDEGGSVFTMAGMPWEMQLATFEAVFLLTSSATNVLR